MTKRQAQKGIIVRLPLERRLVQYSAQSPSTRLTVRKATNPTKQVTNVTESFLTHRKGAPLQRFYLPGWQTETCYTIGH